MDKTELLISKWRAEGIDMVYPLLFKFRTSVVGEGWLAGVELCGAAVVTKEASGEYIAHGLKPGGVAGVGSTLTEAYLAYREDVQTVFYDMPETLRSRPSGRACSSSSTAPMPGARRDSPKAG